MYYILTFFFLAQLCGAEKDKMLDINKTPINIDMLKESTNPDTPSYQWKRVLPPTTSWPSDVVSGGMDSEDYCKEVYVGRAWYKGNLLPAKICSSNGVAYVTYNGSEVRLYDSEVLCSEFAIWKPIKEPRIPSSAFPVGITEQGERLYIGRWFVGLKLVPGKVEANSKMLRMSYARQTYNSSRYEILILKSGDDL